MPISETPLISETQIARRISELAEEISTDYAGENLLVLPILKGGLFFAADLARKLTVPLTMDFVRARSYRGTRSLGTVELLVVPTEELRGSHILIIEDILDTCHTTLSIQEWLLEKEPASISLAVLLEKRVPHIENVRADYIGFEIENHFVVGYGLDCDEHYRNLPAIHVFQFE